MTQARALEILGLSNEPSQAELREAYLAKVKQFPPDSHGAQFQEVRAAYEYLDDPRGRARRGFQGLQDNLCDLWPEAEDSRQFVGPESWLKAMAKG